MADITQPISEPASPIEDFLCSVWSEELNTDRVSLDDNFIVLGGDSIAAAICLTRIQAKFGVDVELGAFLVGTLRDVARTIEAAMESLETADSSTPTP